MGGPASGELGYFNRLIRDNPAGEHDLVDIRGLTLTGSNMAPCPVAGVRATVGVARWLDAEASASAPVSICIRTIKRFEHAAVHTGLIN